jgi:carbamoyl-phosphate synthase large subunit
VKNILVSGASGIVGYGVLRSLKRSEIPLQLIGTTIYDDSVAQGFSDIFELAPLTSDSLYMDWLLKTIRKYRVDLLIPGIEADMYKWINHIPEIRAEGALTLLNNIELIRLCKDKWLFYEYLHDLSLPYTIRTSLNPDFEKLVEEFGLPFLLKPREGYGSKGIVTITDKDSFLKYVKHVGPSLMAQEIVGDINEEYTTSAFCDGQGGFYCYMTLKRKLSKDGFTEKAEVVHVEQIQEALISLCSIFKPHGPTNFQFRKHNGILRLLEINPRISSSTSIRTAFGYNESAMAVNYYLKNIEPIQPTIQPGKAVRYVEDFIMYL